MFAILLAVAMLFLVAWAIRASAIEAGPRLRFILAGSDTGALDLAAADAVLKDDYKGPVVDQLNNANVMLAIVESNTEDIVGRRFVQPLHVGRNSGVGARAENETLPAAGNQQYEDVFGPVRSMYARIQLSGQTIAAMRKDRGSFIRALDPEMQGATEDATRDYCRQVWGTSDGKICGVNTVNSTTLTPANIRQDQLRHLDEGFLVDIGTAADPDSLASGRSIVSVDYDAGSFVISGAAVNVTAGTHFVSRAGAGGASSQSGNPGDGQRELTGLQTHVSASLTDHTLAVATEPRWAASEYTNSGNGNRAISENLVTKALMRTSIKSGGFVNLLISGDGVFRAYGEHLLTLKRTMNEIDLPGGYTGLSHAAVGQGRNKKGSKQALCWDQDCPDNRLYGLTTSDFTMFVMQDWEWMDKAGATLVQVADTDAYSATLKKYAEFACKRRNSQFVITELAEA